MDISIFNKNKKIEKEISFRPSDQGLHFFHVNDKKYNEVNDWLYQDRILSSWEAVSLLQQLIDEELAFIENNMVVIHWSSLYDLIEEDEDSCINEILQIPNEIDIKPVLKSYNSLADDDFSIFLQWSLDGQTALAPSPDRVGGILTVNNKQCMLSKNNWQLASEISSLFYQDNRTQEENENIWAVIRDLAINAQANLDDFLSKTIMIKPKSLDLKMNINNIDSIPVVELLPMIDRMDDVKWISIFDSYSSVKNHYDIVEDDGSLTRIIPDKDVITVLKEIKSFSGRRVSGIRAKQFLRNPYSVLDESMSTVVAPEKFEQAIKDAGVIFYDFTLATTYDQDKKITQVDILLSELNEENQNPDSLPIFSRDDLLVFSKALAKAINKQDPSVFWAKKELEINGNSANELVKTIELLQQSWVNDNIKILASDILDIANYAERITGIDVYKPVFSPYIKKSDDDLGWVPENIDPIISFQKDGEDELSQHPLSIDELKEFDGAVKKAKTNGDTSVLIPGTDHIISIENAEEIITAYQPLLNDEPKIPNLPKVNEPESENDTGKKDLQEKKSLLIAPNIEEIEYIEERGKLLSINENTLPELPSSLKSTTKLKTHQSFGVAWLQNLFSHTPDVCGCIFADDMGLGKTLQLLTFIYWYLENEDKPDPVLIVAPVSLLENWKNEISNFFDTYNKAQLKTMYGPELKNLKLKKHEIDQGLVNQGITKLLKPGWLDNSQIVLTTYETIRDLEISFARERWSIMVCDEAQKIKSPNALVTRAAKKQNVRFKIACTGTPVENTLVDIWCLFDYTQAGLLGALNHFSKEYRKPIESSSDDETEQLEKLRSLVQPQVIRRMKSEVADLPDKIEDNNCRSIKISSKQLNLYSSAVEEYKKYKNSDSEGRGNAAFLSLLHKLRMICANPSDTHNDKDSLKNSPKLVWLLKQLASIEKNNEKVIVFTEFRAIQRLLQHFIQDKFNIKVPIVNGSTKASGTKNHTRQTIIDGFQRAQGFGVIILSTTAVGFGVNIQKANHVIHYTRPWNPAKEDQATDRAYRIGQTKDVHVYYPTIVSDDFITFEKKLDVLLDSKRQLADDMLNGYEDISLNDFNDISDADGDDVTEYIQITEDILSNIKPITFEKLCQQLYAKQGFQAYITKASGDHGVDVVAIKGDKGVLIQCKTAIDPSTRLGWDAVKEVVGGTAHYEDQHKGVNFSKVAATNVLFNNTSKKQAKLNNVTILERNKIIKMSNQYALNLADIYS